MNVACRLFEQTAVLTLTEQMTDQNWTALQPELDELIKKQPHILLLCLVEIPAAVLAKIIEYQKKFKGKEKIITVCQQGKSDAPNIIEGLKLLKSNTAKRIVDILKVESVIKEQNLHLKSAAGVITNQIADLLKLQMPEKPFTSNEVDLHMLTIKKEIIRLTHLNTVFQKEIQLLEKQRPENSNELLSETQIKNKIEVAKNKALDALKAKGLVP